MESQSGQRASRATAELADVTVTPSSEQPKPRLELAFLLLLVAAPSVKAADLKPETLQAWDTYARQAQVSIRERDGEQTPFLWVDETPDLAERVRAGEIVVEPAGGKSPHAVPHGLIHHWVGAVFVPQAKLDDVMSVLNDYNCYKDFYHPLVVKSKLVEETPDRKSVTLLMVQKAYSVTAAVETDNEIEVVRIDSNRGYTLSRSVRVQEVADYGKPSEHALPEDRGPGYVWRSVIVTRFEQRDGGTYVEMEVIALSRGIPVAFRWLVQPLAERLPRSIVSGMLRDTRNAVSRKMTAPSEKSSMTRQSSALQ
jgi:hypothetical protein